MTTLLRRLRRLAAILFCFPALPLTWLALQWIAVFDATSGWLWDGAPWLTTYRGTLKRIFEAW